jgi:hypothetical protein
MQTLSAFGLAALAAFAFTSGAYSERALPPETLTIGYEGEGKVDPSMKACVATVKEITEWNEADTQKGAREVCAARKKHVEAYQALQASYKTFIKEVLKDRRFDWAEAAATVPTLVKTCIAHKFSITTGGHNIRIDIINNEIATGCLVLATNLLRDETRQLVARQTG